MDTMKVVIMLSICCFCVIDSRPESSPSSSAVTKMSGEVTLLERHSRSLDQMVFPDSREEDDVPIGGGTIQSMRMRRPLSPTPASNSDCRQIKVIRHANGTLGHRYVDCSINSTNVPREPTIGSRFGGDQDKNTRGSAGASVTGPAGNGRDHIVFPSESGEVNTEPGCANGHRFCTEDPSYPKSEIEQLLQRVGNLNDLLQTDVPDDTELVQRVDVPGEETFCDYDSRMEYPTKALSRDEKWLPIVNHSNYTQGIRMEICRNIERPCKMAEVFPYSIKTRCIQKYQYRQLLALHEDGQLRREYFSMPTCCLCTFSKM